MLVSLGTQVCADAELKGEISIGQRCFVHPKARIIAEAGPIIMGDGNMIEEQALIINELVKLIYIIDQQTKAYPVIYWVELN